jgi:uncharacterized protein YutE (UPF0331/DUF86 family)
LKNDFRIRLIKRISFLEKELDEYKKFQSLSWNDYNQDRDKRRNVERWIENIVTSSVDIARIILAAEDKTLPDTYKELVNTLSLIPGFENENMKKLAEWVRFRNIIVHEYLDIKWKSIKKFIQETEAIYREFLNRVKSYLNEKLVQEEKANGEN